MFQKVFVLFVLLPTACFTAKQKADLNSCTAFDEEGSGCLDSIKTSIVKTTTVQTTTFKTTTIKTITGKTTTVKTTTVKTTTLTTTTVKTTKQKVPVSEFLKFLAKPDMKSLERAHELVKQRRINVSETVPGGSVPVVFYVVNFYTTQDVNHLSMKQYRARKRKILQIICDMFATGADPNAVLRGKQMLQSAIRDGDVDFCRCLIKGGARLSDKGGLLYRWLAYSWGSSAPVADFVKGLISFRAHVAAGKLDSIHRVSRGRYLHVYDASASWRKMAIDGNTSAASGDYSRLDILNILADMLEALLLEVASAVDFQRVVAIGHQSKSGRNVFHFSACSAPRSILAFARTAARAGAKAAKSTLRMLQAGNALGRTPFHIAAACSSTGQEHSNTTFDALLLAAEELSAAAGVKFKSPGAFLAALPKDKLGLSYSESLRSTEKVANHETSLPRPWLPDSTKLSGGWSVRADGTVGLDSTTARQCDVTILQSPSPAELFTRHVILSKPVLLHGEALNYKVRKSWKKKEFLKRHGNLTFNLGKIPYAEAYGAASENHRVKDYVGSFNKSTSDIPLYAFGNTYVTQNPALKKDIESTPSILQNVVIDGKPLSLSTPQFYLGPPKSGAMLHFHKDAVNVLAYGRKHWFLQPPDQAIYSTRHISEWMTDAKNLGSSRELWQCVQEAGDVIYVPVGWAHATLNLEESIGVAYEFEAPTASLMAWE